MGALQGQPRVWTAYRRFYVREGLQRGLSRALIAERLGLTLSALNTAIWAHGLNKPEADHA